MTHTKYISAEQTDTITFKLKNAGSHIALSIIAAFIFVGLPVLGLYIGVKLCMAFGLSA
jgi:hypothetical protein